MKDISANRELFGDFNILFNRLLQTTFAVGVLEPEVDRFSNLLVGASWPRQSKLPVSYLQKQ